jgi:hypothetical protein
MWTPVPDPLLLRGSAGNRIRDLWICSQELWPLDRRLQFPNMSQPLPLDSVCVQTEWKTDKQSNMPVAIGPIISFANATKSYCSWHLSKIARSLAAVRNNSCPPTSVQQTQSKLTRKNTSSARATIYYLLFWSLYWLVQPFRSSNLLRAEYIYEDYS